MNLGPESATRTRETGTRNPALIVRQHPLELAGVGGRHHFGVAHMPLAALRLAGQDVALERLRVPVLAPGGFLEALRGASVALDLRHLVSLRQTLNVEL